MASKAVDVGPIIFEGNLEDIEVNVFRSSVSINIDLPSIRLDSWEQAARWARLANNQVRVTLVAIENDTQD